MSTGTRIGLVAAIPILIFLGISASHHASSAVSGRMLSSMHAHTITPPVAPEKKSGAHDESEEADGVVDLYGNEVTDAVAKYKADGAGALYELHSPQTEVPRLGSPKS